MTKGFDVQGLRSNAKSILMRDRRRDYKLAGNCIDNRIAYASCFTLTAVGAVPVLAGLKKRVILMVGRVLITWMRGGLSTSRLG